MLMAVRSRFLPTRLRCAIGAFSLTLPLLAFAQAPLYLPAEIPLDTAAIYQDMHPEADYADVTVSIINQLRRNHYSKVTIDDAFSETLLDSYIDALDGARLYFTQQDIDSFQRYRHELDDQLLDGDIAVGYDIFNLYHRRLEERLVFSLQLIENQDYQFDFTVDEYVEIDREDAPWPASHEELEDIWRRQLKSSVLSMKMAYEDDEFFKVREKLSERYRSQLSQVLKTKPVDVFQRYMDAVTMTVDPHTQYYPPRAAENFNMNMRLSLEGIGAVLRTENEFTKVESIVTGGPADLAGELQPSDRIVGVAQGDDPFVDVIGWRIDDVVQLIRGEKGSVVKLNVIPASSSAGLERKVISITRDTVKLEDSSAKKEIVEVEYEGTTHKIGVIDLPSFYVDFEAWQRRDPDYRSTTRDVHKLLDELKEENVEGIVVDLRQNGGGSLSEANSLAGLFISRGPTVQVKDADGNKMAQGDSNPLIAYEGPLAVLVNRLSASASEIFAGAIQDYQRGVVVGGQTYGKGTVQELIPMNDGQMKITRAKFYRISGESTQHKGVTPDVVLPDIYDAAEDIGESALPTALPWDTIEPSFYRPYTNLKQVIPELSSRSVQRVAADPDFNFIEAQIQHMIDTRDRNQLTLNESKLLAEREAEDAWRLEIENKRRVAKGQEPLASLDDLDDEEQGDQIATVDDFADAPVARDEENNEESGQNLSGTDEQEEKADEPDPYLVESGRILLDLLELQQGDALTMSLRRQAAR